MPYTAPFPSPSFSTSVTAHRWLHPRSCLAYLPLLWASLMSSSHPAHDFRTINSCSETYSSRFIAHLPATRPRLPCRSPPDRPAYVWLQGSNRYRVNLPLAAGGLPGLMVLICNISWNFFFFSWSLFKVIWTYGVYGAVSWLLDQPACCCPVTGHPGSLAGSSRFAGWHARRSDLHGAEVPQPFLPACIALLLALATLLPS